MIPWDLDNLDFKPWLAFGRDPYSGGDYRSEYATYAVIEHHGGTYGGHYRMYARHRDAWHEYDDSSVMPVTPDRVVTSDSYIMLMMPRHNMDYMSMTMNAAIDKYRAFHESSTADVGAAKEA